MTEILIEDQLHIIEYGGTIDIYLDDVNSQTESPVLFFWSCYWSDVVSRQIALRIEETLYEQE